MIAIPVLITKYDTISLFLSISPLPELDLKRYDLESVSSSQEFPLQGLIHIPGKTKATLKEIIDHLHKVYCSKIGFEFLYIQVHMDERMSVY